MKNWKIKRFYIPNNRKKKRKRKSHTKIIYHFYFQVNSWLIVSPDFTFQPIDDYHTVSVLYIFLFFFPFFSFYVFQLSPKCFSTWIKSFSVIDALCMIVIFDKLLSYVLLYTYNHLSYKFLYVIFDSKSIFYSKIWIEGI